MSNEEMKDILIKIFDMQNIRIKSFHGQLKIFLNYDALQNLKSESGRFKKVIPATLGLSYIKNWQFCKLNKWIDFETYCQAYKSNEKTIN